MHHAYTVEAQDIGDLVRIGEHGGGAMRDHSAGELCRGQHARLDMHMPVAEARDHVAACGVDDLRLGPDLGSGVGDHASDAPLPDGDVVVGKCLARVHIHPCPAFDHKISGRASSSSFNEVGGRVGPCKHMFHVPVFQILRRCARGPRAIS